MYGFFRSHFIALICCLNKVLYFVYLSKGLRGSHPSYTQWTTPMTVCSAKTALLKIDPDRGNLDDYLTQRENKKGNKITTKKDFTDTFDKLLFFLYKSENKVFQ